MQYQHQHSLPMLVNILPYCLFLDKRQILQFLSEGMSADDIISIDRAIYSDALYEAEQEMKGVDCDE